MLPSGYLIRPCEGGGSIIHIVDHLNLEALRYIGQIAHESSGEVVYGLGRQPTAYRTLSQRLSRGFNDVVNGFNDDGRSFMNCDGVEDVIVAVNSTKNILAISTHFCSN